MRPLANDNEPEGFPIPWLCAATDETLRMTMAHAAGLHASRKGNEETATVLRRIADRLEGL